MEIEIERAVEQVEKALAQPKEQGSESNQDTQEILDELLELEEKRIVRQHSVILLTNTTERIRRMMGAKRPMRRGRLAL